MSHLCIISIWYLLWRIWCWLTHIGSTCCMQFQLDAVAVVCCFSQSTFPFEIKCVTNQRATVESLLLLLLFLHSVHMTTKTMMTIIGHLGQFKCSALSSGQKETTKILRRKDEKKKHLLNQSYHFVAFLFVWEDSL